MQASVLLPRLPLVSAGTLFAEDFDAQPVPPPRDEPSPPPEPEVIAPIFTLADLDAARTEGVADGLAQAHRDAETADRLATQVVRAQLSQALAAAGVEVARIAEASATALAELLLRTLTTILPELCARHGTAEATAISAALLPALTEEPHIAISIAPEAAQPLHHVIVGLDPPLRQRITLTESDAMAPGDITIRWQHGRAVRSTTLLMDAIDQALRSCLPIPSSHAEHNDAG